MEQTPTQRSPTGELKTRDMAIILIVLWLMFAGGWDRVAPILNRVIPERPTAQTVVMTATPAALTPTAPPQPTPITVMQPAVQPVVVTSVVVATPTTAPVGTASPGGVTWQGGLHIGGDGASIGGQLDIKSNPTSAALPTAEVVIATGYTVNADFTCVTALNSRGRRVQYCQVRSMSDPEIKSVVDYLRTGMIKGTEVSP